MVVRSGETDRSWFRSDRFIHTADGWYFLTRENTQEGPFGSLKEAQNELNLYLRHMGEDLYKTAHG